MVELTQGPRPGVPAGMAAQPCRAERHVGGRHAARSVCEPFFSFAVKT